MKTNRIKKLLIGAVLLTATMLNLGQSSPSFAVTSIRVVSHPGQDRDLLSELSYKEWVQLRKNTKSDRVRIYTALGAGEYRIAAQDARNYLAQKPRDFDALVVLATSLAMQGEYDKAAYFADLIEKYYPGRSVTLNLRGLARLRQPMVGISGYNEAALMFKQALDTSDTEVAAALNLGHLYLEMGNGREALQAFKTAEARCNGCVTSLIGQGSALILTRSYSAAQEKFVDVLEKSPSNLEAQYQLAMVALTGFNDLKKAKNHLEVILESQTNKQQDVRRRANVLMRRLEAKIDGRPSMLN